MASTATVDPLQISLHRNCMQRHRPPENLPVPSPPPASARAGTSAAAIPGRWCCASARNQPRPLQLPPSMYAHLGLASPAVHLHTTGLTPVVGLHVYAGRLRSYRNARPPWGLLGCLWAWVWPCLLSPAGTQGLTYS